MDIREFEERFFAVVWNYIEFDEEIARAITSFRLTSIVEHDLFARFNQRLLNLLCSIGSYHDQGARSLKRLNQHDSGLEGAVKQKFSSRYDDVLEYRLLEAVRNFAKHHSLPITHFRFDIAGRRIDGEEEIDISLSPELDVLRLCETSDLKALIRQELAQRGKPVDCKKAVRSYTKEFAVGHYYYRARTEELLERCRLTLVRTLSTLSSHYKQDFNESEYCFMKVENDEGKMRTIQHSMFPGLMEKRVKYTKLTEIARFK